MPSPRSHSDLCREIVRLLQQEREKRGWTKYSPAAKSGGSQEMIGYLERGLRAPSFETVLRLTDAIGLDLGDLVRRARGQRAPGAPGSSPDRRS